MISNLAMAVFTIELILVAGFAVWCLKIDDAGILHHLYLSMLLLYTVWIIPLMLMRIAGANSRSLWLLDSVTSIGAYTIPAIFLCIALAFIHHEKRFRKWMAYILLIPTLNVFVIFTNPLHHLQYETFSIIRSEIEFGPYIYVTGGYSYLCLLAAIIVLLVFAIRNDSRLYWKQVSLLVIGAIPPMVVNYFATFSSMNISIAATPMCFAFVIVLHGLAIYQEHLLDIKPIAMESVHDTMRDAFIVLSKSMLIINFNRRFEEEFAIRHNIQVNRYADENDAFLGPILERIQNLNEYDEYETVIEDKYYSIRISEVRIHDETEGYIVILRDVTELARSMNQLKESREKLIRQEKLALLGQMTAGLAHNLKSPIMGAAGCVSALDDLTDEARESLGDDEVTSEDYMEMLSEADSWLEKIEESLDYMSTMITEIKDRAVSAMSEEETLFPAEEIYRICCILMEHELINGKCTLEFDDRLESKTYIYGNMNTLVQAVNNIISNAAYSQKRCGGGRITLEMARMEGGLIIRVSDTGEGMSDKVKSQLFRSMVTTKGTKGTGLGLYISDITIRENYGGRMWVCDNVPKGVTACIFIPEDRVRFKDEEEQKEE